MSQVEQLAAGDLPPGRDFILSAGFAGLLALLAALIVLGAVLYAARGAGQRFLTEREEGERHHEERRQDAKHAAAVERCWDRWWQVLQTAALEPAASEGATLGLGPEVTLVLLRGLLRDAEQLGDETLTKAIAVYQEQLVLVLAQQSGPLSKLVGSPAASSNGDLDFPPPAKKQPPSAAEGTPADDGDLDFPPPAKKRPPAEGTPADGSNAKPRLRPTSHSATGAATDPSSAETRTAATEETGRRR